MPFGLKNAPIIYQRIIDNALWGFVRPKGGCRAFADRMQAAEERADKSRQLRNEASRHWSANPQNVRTKFDAAHEDSVTTDPVLQQINSPDVDMFTTSEADTSTLVPVFDRRSFVDDICFDGKTFDECLATLDKLLGRFEECRISISFTKSIFAQSRVDFLSHDISRDVMRANSKKLTEIAKLPFPKTKKGVQSFLGAINYYGRCIQDFAAYGAALYQLKDDVFKPGATNR
ncbi:unnamed protein product [Phytophthora fragariaefolia]|uniref:Unnamed protein product n=1 Tax=Phytophthora fragariaefolia TaxID=1490495 RepID=A0A9W6XDH0_9STRA|nr:unnamed protein product [Phytophthora fragariaefolia]